MLRAQRPRDRAAEIVADDVYAFSANRVRQRDDVGREPLHPVGTPIPRASAWRVTALVRREHSITGFRQVRSDTPPTRPGLRVAVKKDDGTAVAGSRIGELELETVVFEAAGSAFGSGAVDGLIRFRVGHR